MISHIPKSYFQKSKVFLYPLLGIPKGVEFIPVNTYVAWNDKIEFNEYKFLCVYDISKLSSFRDFEVRYLTGNKRFSNFHFLESSKGYKGLYVFDYSDFFEDYLFFLSSNYSMLSDSSKNIILKFFKNDSSGHEIVDSYLNPGNYYNQYAKILNVDIDLLREVRELCPLLNLEQETLEANELIVEL